MIYGYARVSTQDHNLDSQIEQLIKYGVDEIVKEKISGVSKQKPLLDELFSKIASDDTLVVTRMDRLGRNTVQLLQLGYGNDLHIEGPLWKIMDKLTKPIKTIGFYLL